MRGCGSGSTTRTGSADALGVHRLSAPDPAVRRRPRRRRLDLPGRDRCSAPRPVVAAGLLDDADVCAHRGRAGRGRPGRPRRWPRSDQRERRRDRPPARRQLATATSRTTAARGQPGPTAVATPWPHGRQDHGGCRRATPAPPPRVDRHSDRGPGQHPPEHGTTSPERAAGNHPACSGLCRCWRSCTSAGRRRIDGSKPGPFLVLCLLPLGCPRRRDLRQGALGKGSGSGQGCAARS